MTPPRPPISSLLQLRLQLQPRAIVRVTRAVKRLERFLLDSWRESSERKVWCPAGRAASLYP
jgi:hypothetical protein